MPISKLCQVEEDFSTAPFLHVGGDEPTAASLCALLEHPLRQQCWEQCSSSSSHGCAAVPKKPEGSNVTWWFPEYLNQKVQDYFDPSHNWDLKQDLTSLVRDPWDPILGNYFEDHPTGCNW